MAEVKRSPQQQTLPERKHGMLYNLLWDVIPAHIEIHANQQVNNYSSAGLYIGGVMSSAFMQTI